MRMLLQIALIAASVPSPAQDAVGPAQVPALAGKSKADRLLALHTEDAASYSFALDGEGAGKLELRREPVLRWLNSITAGGQVGDVFVWTNRGRPEVVGTIFSFPDQGGRAVCHELHSLAQGPLIVERDSPRRWRPQAPGVELKPIEGAPTPAASAAKRLVQMNALAREFSGRSLGANGETWELRALPRAIYRYESTDPVVIDGALFAFVTTAGTDPEIILLLEDRESTSGPAWAFGAARFSEKDVRLKRKDKEVWTATWGAEDSFYFGKQRNWFSKDRIIPELDEPKP